MGLGKSLEDALGEMHMVAEGVRATRMFRDRSKKMGYETPFLDSLGKLLDGEIGAEDAVKRMVESHNNRES